MMNKNHGHRLRATINDIEIEYDLIGAGEPMVLVHGGQGDRESFENLIPELSQHYTILTFDQRGSGNSSKPDMEYTISLLADDTAQLMEYVGFEKAHVFGVSMGGLIAENLAIHHPEKVKSLILGCTLPGSWDKTVKIDHSDDVAIAFSPDESIDPFVRANALASVAFAEGYVNKHPDIIEVLVNQRRNKPINKIGLTQRMAAVRTFDDYEKLSSIKCPTLIITGDDDKLVAWQNSQILAEQIRHAKLVVLEQAGHIFWVEKKEQTLLEIYVFTRSLSYSQC